MQKLFLIGAAGFAGTVARYLVSGWVARRAGETFPTGTLVANLAGCFLIGVLAYLFQERYLVPPLLRTLILIGFLGGFTTFSSFALHTLALARDGEFELALLNIFLSNLGGLFMVWLGYTLPQFRGGGT